MILAFFPTQDAALGFFHAAKKELKEVLAYEYFDASALELLKRDFSIPESSGAVFFEKIIRDFDAETSQIEKLLQAHGSSMESVWAGESEKEMEKIKKMKMERFTKPAKNVHEITIAKRKYAIMKTVLSQKHQGENI